MIKPQRWPGQFQHRSVGTSPDSDSQRRTVLAKWRRGRGSRVCRRDISISVMSHSAPACDNPVNIIGQPPGVEELVEKRNRACCRQVSAFNSPDRAAAVFCHGADNRKMKGVVCGLADKHPEFAQKTSYFDWDPRPGIALPCRSAQNARAFACQSHCGECCGIDRPARQRRQWALPIRRPPHLSQACGTRNVCDLWAHAGENGRSSAPINLGSTIAA